MTEPQASPAENQQLAKAIAVLIETNPFRWGAARELEDGLSYLFGHAGVHTQRNVAMPGGTVLDFLAGRVGIEVGVERGSNALLRRLSMFAQSGQLDALVVVATAAHAQHRSLEGADIALADPSGDGSTHSYVPVTIARLPLSHRPTAARSRMRS